MSIYSGFKPIIGMTIVQVEAGTKIKDPRTGREIEVTETEGASLNGTLYVTKSTYDSIRAAQHRLTN